MRALTRMLAAVVVLAMSAGTVCAAIGKTTTDVALRRAPTAQAELILNLSQGTLVNVDDCSRGWCGVTLEQVRRLCAGERTPIPERSGKWPPALPVYPPYPYKAGHYPTADAYYDLPPYAATDPSFYRWRHFLTAQERNRYRYMPHIFRGYTGYRDETVGSYVSSTGNQLTHSPPTTEPSPLRLNTQAPEVSPPPAAPEPSPKRQRYRLHPLHPQHQLPKRQKYYRHPLPQHRPPRRQKYHRHPLHRHRALRRRRHHLLRSPAPSPNRPKDHSASPSTNYVTRPKVGASTAQFSVNRFTTRRMNASDRSMTSSSREISRLHTQSSMPAAFSA